MLFVHQLATSLTGSPQLHGVSSQLSSPWTAEMAIALLGPVEGLMSPSTVAPSHWKQRDICFRS